MSEENMNINTGETGDFSLESILAEYKGSAYIDGDKKTPSDVLDKKAQKIVMEVTGKSEEPDDIGQDTLPYAPEQYDEPEPEPPVDVLSLPYSGPDSFFGMGEADTDFNQVSAVYRPDSKEKHSVTRDEDVKLYNPKKGRIKATPMGSAIRSSILSEGDENEFFAPLDAASKRREKTEVRYSALEPDDEIQEEVQSRLNATERETDQYFFEEETEEARKARPRILRIFGGEEENGEQDDCAVQDEFEDEPELEPELEPEEEIEDIDLKKAMARFAARCNSVSTRFLGAFFVTLVMAVFTFVFDSGASMAFGIGRDVRIASGALLVMQIIVMLFSTDILWRGTYDLIRGEPGAESVIAASCFFTIIAAFCSVFGYYGDMGAPYCLIVASALTFALWGEKKYLAAMVYTAKIASSSENLRAIVPYYSENMERTILRQSQGGVSGFYANLVQADFCENTYRYAAPVIMISAIVFAFLTSLGHNRNQYFVHFLSALLAVGSSFSAFFAYSVPFENAVRNAKRSGAVIAGWGGAEEMYYSDGACVTDEDVFPPGTLSMGGFKLFENVSAEVAIRYTSSLIITSGSGLSQVFTALLDEKAMLPVRVDNFACYEGGVGGLIKGSRVLIGSSAFMNLMGIRVPTDIDMNNIVFTAVNDRLIAAFIINYIPANSVQGAILNLMEKNVDMFFANKDFNITPQMLGSKFKIPFEGVNQMPASDMYEDESYPNLKVVALLGKAGLGAFGAAITEGKKLRMLTCVTTVTSVATTALGVLIVFFLCWAGAFGSLKPGNIFIYMMAMTAIVVLIGNIARPRR